MAKAVDVGPKPKEAGAETAKPKSGTFTLRNGHATTFRRTVTLDGSSLNPKKPTADAEKVQLAFEPGVDYPLSEVEVAGCQDLIDAGILVPANRDDKGRNKPIAASPRTDADSTIDKLEKKVEELAAENAALKAKLAAAPKVTIPPPA
jgi:hypothetical protein